MTPNTRRPALQTLGNDYGIGQGDASDLLGVPVSRLRLLRRGAASPTPEEADELNRLIEVLEALAEYVDEPATWLTRSLVEGFNLRPIDVYRAVAPGVLLDLASGAVDAAEVLDHELPNWRNEWRSHFEVFTAADGELSMRPRRCACEDRR
ncbi:Uncharacterised protein (plasmid) [Tsukamurella tyrosinosolvens]|uniref:Helix-turn-helix domain-containing protein n=1 Tax=Tsukamurella tyrosinosolvens TaxID=57704 RepID=A0A1H4VLE0_TSUTY|nr:hypothetical protein [Tsukamurella tyrosinosolvens]KXO90945.1 hypothetical protein AXK58_21160 [Tsukamurella tyrosinosolvens]SEC81836.1 hypothetical protein SAMN04489793_3266 [Tsukamurella tyrosinosolvens]VEH90442.1 Uncharacterised protein [Tsukamurella tyrosinosolvens]